jgi:hypothetical protein
VVFTEQKNLLNKPETRIRHNAYSPTGKLKIFPETGLADFFLLEEVNKAEV